MYTISRDPSNMDYILHNGKVIARAPATSEHHALAHKAYSKKYPSPDLAMRLWHAAELAKNGNIHPIDTPPLSGDVAQVQSETDPRKIYTIRHFKPENELSAPAVVEKWQYSCTCADFASGRARVKHQKVCKHVLAVMLQSWLDSQPQPQPAASHPEAPARFVAPPVKHYRDMTDAERDEYHAARVLDEKRQRMNRYSYNQKMQEAARHAAATAR